MTLKLCLPLTLTTNRRIATSWDTAELEETLHGGAPWIPTLLSSFAQCGVDFAYSLTAGSPAFKPSLSPA